MCIIYVSVGASATEITDNCEPHVGSGNRIQVFYKSKRCVLNLSRSLPKLERWEGIGREGGRESELQLSQDSGSLWLSYEL